MTQRNFITSSEVPQKEGGAEEDLEKVRAYLYKMVGQLEYVLGNLEKRISELEKGQE